MPSERTLALPLPLFQRASEDLGSAAYEALSSDLGWARWMSPLPARSGERIPPSKSSRSEPLNRSSRRKEALISLSPRSLSLLTSAAFEGREHLQNFDVSWGLEPGKARRAGFPACRFGRHPCRPSVLRAGCPQNRQPRWLPYERAVHGERIKARGDSHCTPWALVVLLYVKFHTSHRRA